MGLVLVFGFGFIPGADARFQFCQKFQNQDDAEANNECQNRRNGCQLNDLEGNGLRDKAILYTRFHVGYTKGKLDTRRDEFSCSLCNPFKVACNNTGCEVLCDAFAHQKIDKSLIDDMVVTSSEEKGYFYRRPRDSNYRASTIDTPEGAREYHGWVFCLRCYQDRQERRRRLQARLRSMRH